MFRDFTIQPMRLMLKIPITQEEMVNAVVETVRKNNLKDSYVRLVVTRGVGDLGLDPRKCCIANSHNHS